MNPPEWQILQTVALASLLAWASGVRLYLVVFALGLASRLEYYALPEGLKVLSHTYVLAASGFLLVMEFLADKVPGLDSAWDAVHTFIRIPAGALLAAGASGDSISAFTVAAGLLGGSITAGTHFTKASGRAVINTSPEPVSNWVTSLGEDFAVMGGIWLALMHPAVFIGLMVLFLLLLAWLLPKLWRLARKLWGSLLPRRVKEGGASG